MSDPAKLKEDLLAALPPRWVHFATLCVVVAHTVVYVGTWVAAHGGLVGIYQAVVFGK